MPNPGAASSSARLSAGTGALLGRMSNSSSWLWLAFMADIPPDSYVRGISWLNDVSWRAISVVRDGGAIAAVVAAVHGFLHGLLRAPPGASGRVGIWRGWGLPGPGHVRFSSRAPCGCSGRPAEASREHPGSHRAAIAAPSQVACRPAATSRCRAGGAERSGPGTHYGQRLTPVAGRRPAL